MKCETRLLAQSEYGVPREWCRGAWILQLGFGCQIILRVFFAAGQFTFNDACCLHFMELSRILHFIGRISDLKDDFQSVLRSLRTQCFLNIIINGSLDGMRITTYLIFETFQILFPTASLIFTAVKLFHKVI